MTDLTSVRLELHARVLLSRQHRGSPRPTEPPPGLASFAAL